MTGIREHTNIVEIVDTPEQAATLPLPPLLIREPVERFLDEHGLGSGPLTAKPLGDGHSNVTYCIRREGAQVVLRRPPRPPLPPSAHDVLRESRILRGLEHADVPVPRVLATCADESLLGVPFYVMEYLDGCVLTRTTPPALAQPAHRAAIGERIDRRAGGAPRRRPGGVRAGHAREADGLPRAPGAPLQRALGGRADARAPRDGRVDGVAVGHAARERRHRRSCTATTGSAT